MKNVLFAVTVKQPIVFPLAPLYNAGKFAYARLNHSSFSNLAFGQIYIERASEFVYPLACLMKKNIDPIYIYKREWLVLNVESSNNWK